MRKEDASQPQLLAQAGSSSLCSPGWPHICLPFTTPFHMLGVLVHATTFEHLLGFEEVSRGKVFWVAKLQKVKSLSRS